MNNRLHILLVEDEPSDAALVEEHLQRAELPYLLHHVQRREDFLRGLQTLRYDVILCDFTLPGWNGLEALETAQQLAPHTPFIIVTGSINEETAVECMKAGAADYVLKDQGGKLPRAILATIERQKHKEQKELAEAALRESERRFRTLADTAPVLIWMSDNAGDGIYFNQPWVDFTGRELAAHLQEGWTESLHPADAPAVLAALYQALTARQPFELEHRLRGKDGGHRWFLNRGRPRWLPTGAFLGFIGSCVDITERREAEERLNQSLREKDVLLKEVHHRVKNNMQVISSLFSLAAARQTSPELVAIFRENQNRVQSMALVHEKLYGKADLACVNFRDYLHDLTTHLFRSFGAIGRVQYVLDTEPVPLSVDHAIPCALIANELISNALKHAFPGGRTGTLTLSLHQTAELIRLEVGDDGVGLPAGRDPLAGDTLGLQIVQTLVHQLGGRLTVQTGPATCFQVEFHRAAARQPAFNHA